MKREDANPADSFFVCVNCLNDLCRELILVHHKVIVIHIAMSPHEDNGLHN